MAVDIKRVWKITERPWGFDVRVDFIDENKNIFNEELSFKKIPTKEEVDSEVEARRVKLEDRISIEKVQPSPEYEIINEDGTTMLI